MYANQKKLLVALGLVLSLTACKQQDIYSHLPEQEVNEMIVLLQGAGINATKTELKDNTFSVSASSELFASAVNVLTLNGYPKKAFLSVCDVFKKEGFVSTPIEERARLNCAQSQELSNTLESIDGVVMARVHLAIPESDPLSDDVKEASASVFIKYRRDVDITAFEGKIKGLVVDGIEGLPYSNVTVGMFPMARHQPVRQTVDQNSLPAKFGSILTPASAGLIGVSLLFFFFISWLMLRQKKQKNTLPAVVADTVSPRRPVNRSGPVPGQSRTVIPAMNVPDPARKFQ